VRVTVQLLRASEIKIGFVNGNLLNDWAPGVKEAHHLMRDLAVAIMAWLYKNKLRTTCARNMCRECRPHTERARLIVCGADHTALSVTITNRNRLSSKRRIVTDLYRRKEGVKVNVKDAARCERVRCLQPFLLSATQLANSSVQQ
jgi:hypothetical protein